MIIIIRMLGFSNLLFYLAASSLFGDDKYPGAVIKGHNTVVQFEQCRLPPGTAMNAHSVNVFLFVLSPVFAPIPFPLFPDH